MKKHKKRHHSKHVQNGLRGVNYRPQDNYDPSEKVLLNQRERELITLAEGTRKMNDFQAKVWDTIKTKQGYRVSRKQYEIFAGLMKIKM